MIKATRRESSTFDPHVKLVVPQPDSIVKHGTNNYVLAATAEQLPSCNCRCNGIDIRLLQPERIQCHPRRLPIATSRATTLFVVNVPK